MVNERLLCAPMQAAVLADDSVVVSFSDNDDEEDIASLAERLLFSKTSGKLHHGAQNQPFPSAQPNLVSLAAGH